MEESIEVLDSIDDGCKKPAHGRSNEQMILSNPADVNQSSRLWSRETNTMEKRAQKPTIGILNSMRQDWLHLSRMNIVLLPIYKSSRLYGAEILHKHHPEPAEKATIGTLNKIYGIPLRLQSISQSFT